MMTDHSSIQLFVNGQVVSTKRGETVAAVLLAEGYQILRHTGKGALRGVFCGMGVCFDCLVTVDGIADVRACMTTVRPGMRIETGSVSNG
jgi:predicted molibdopterin-dependent oxidoreductase YjgC